MVSIRSRVLDIIERVVGFSPVGIDDSFSFTKDLGLDSLDVIDIIIETERTFDIRIPDDDVTDISTVGDLILYIEKRISY